MKPGFVGKGRLNPLTTVIPIGQGSLALKKIFGWQPTTLKMHPLHINRIRMIDRSFPPRHDRNSHERSNPSKFFSLA